jgi:hypothetical protein
MTAGLATVLAKLDALISALKDESGFCRFANIEEFCRFSD